jgi:hypothetical protein
MTVYQSPEDLDSLVAEAEAISKGDDPSKLAGTGGDAPASPEIGEGAGSPSSAPSPASFTEISALGLLVIDSGFLLAFGPGSAMPDPLRGEAQKNLELICAKYLPAVSNVGPEMALVSLVAIHAFNCYQANGGRTAAQSRATSGNVGAEKAPSSDATA